MAVFKVSGGKATGRAVPIHTIPKNGKFAIKSKGGDVIGQVKTKGVSGKIKAKDADGNIVDDIKFDDSVRQIDDAPAYIMPKEMIRELTKVDLAFKGERETRDMLRMFDKVMAMWKGYAVASPGFLSRNGQSNIFANWLGGVPVNPKKYAEAMRLQAGKTKGMMLKVGDKVYKDNEIMRLVDTHGVRGNSGYQKDLGIIDADEDMLNSLQISAGKDGAGTRQALGSLNNPVATALAEHEVGRGLMKRMSDTFGSGGKILTKNREIGGAMENNAKIVHFIHKIRQGMSPEDAAQSVKKYLFDYGELTDFERKFMRRTIPFYTWVRKNVPLMYGELLNNPGKFSRVPKAMTAVQNLNTDKDEGAVPDYFQEIMAQRQPKGVDRVVRDVNTFLAKGLYSMGALKEKPEELTGLQPVYLKPDLPFQDLDIGAKDILSGLTPLLRVPMEMAMGEGKGFSFFLDRPLENFEGEPAEVSLIPGGSAVGLDFKLREKYQSAIEGLLPTLGKVNRIRKRAQRGQLASQLSSEFFGVKFLQNDVNQAAGLKGTKLRNRIRDLKKRLREEGRMEGTRR